MLVRDTQCFHTMITIYCRVGYSQGPTLSKTISGATLYLRANLEVQV